jgi:hypothetical protein
LHADLTDKTAQEKLNILRNARAQAKGVTRSTRSPLLSRRDVTVPTRPYVALRESVAEHREKEAAEYRELIKDVARFQANQNVKCADRKLDV